MGTRLGPPHHKACMFLHGTCSHVAPRRAPRLTWTNGRKLCMHGLATTRETLHAWTLDVTLSYTHVYSCPSCILQVSSPIYHCMLFGGLCNLHTWLCMICFIVRLFILRSLCHCLPRSDSVATSRGIYIKTEEGRFFCQYTHRATTSVH